jgi:GDP-L-fucose synthase
MMDKKSRIYVAGHQGLVGSALMRRLGEQGYTEVGGRTRRELDLVDEKRVDSFFNYFKPEFVFLAAAKVGGIQSNKNFPADFITENLRIQTNVIKACHDHETTKLLFLGSVCAYPKLIDRSLREEDLLTGRVEPTSEAYAIAKLTGIKMCQAYRQQHNDNFLSAIPSNTYGVNDNFDPNDSHVIPAMIERFHRAKLTNLPEVVCWGTGRPRREFLYVDDVADALIFLMNTYEGDTHINVGGGVDYSMKQIAEVIAETVGYRGNIVWDTSKPDGMMHRKLDSSRLLRAGWRPTIGIRDGLKKTYDWFLQH